MRLATRFNDSFSRGRVYAETLVAVNGPYRRMDVRQNQRRADQSEGEAAGAKRPSRQHRALDMRTPNQQAAFLGMAA